MEVLSTCEQITGTVESFINLAVLLPMHQPYIWPPDGGLSALTEARASILLTRRGEQ